MHLGMAHNCLKMHLSFAVAMEEVVFLDRWANLTSDASWAEEIIPKAAVLYLMLRINISHLGRHGNLS